MDSKTILLRLHQYLGLALLPWMLVYGLSSLLFNHSGLIRPLFDDGRPNWTVRFEKPYSRPLAADADLRNEAVLVLAAAGFSGDPGFYKPNDRRLNVHIGDFWHVTRISYLADEGKLVVEDKKFRWDDWLSGLHERSGYHRDSWLHDAWAMVLDLFCLSLVLWIASGVYFWWGIRGTRGWGTLALGGGLATFVIFMLTL